MKQPILLWSVPQEATVCVIKFAKIIEFVKFTKALFKQSMNLIDKGFKPDELRKSRIFKDFP